MLSLSLSLSLSSSLSCYLVYYLCVTFFLCLHHYLFFLSLSLSLSSHLFIFSIKSSSLFLSAHSYSLNRLLLTLSLYPSIPTRYIAHSLFLFCLADLRCGCRFRSRLSHLLALRAGHGEIPSPYANWMLYLIHSLLSLLCFLSFCAVFLLPDPWQLHFRAPVNDIWCCGYRWVWPSSLGRSFHALPKQSRWASVSLKSVWENRSEIWLI